MTKHGSLAYYLAAWVCGSFFFIVGRYYRVPAFRDTGPLSFHVEYVTTLVVGAPALLLFAFLLRRLARLLRWSQPWHWTLGGACLTLLLGAPVLLVPPWDDTRLRLLFNFVELFALHRAAFFPGVFGREVFTIVFGGAATSYILFRIHQAFASQTNQAQ